MRPLAPLIAVAMIATPGQAAPRRPLPLATCVSVGNARACDRVVTVLAARLLGDSSTAAEREKAEKLARTAVAILRGPVPAGPLADVLARCRASECTACMQVGDALEALFAHDGSRPAAPDALVRALADALRQAAAPPAIARD